MTSPAQRFPRHAMQLASLLCMAIFLVAACATAPDSTTLGATDDAELLGSFAAGRSQLTELTAFQGYSAATKEAMVAMDLRGLYDTRSWRSLAALVVRTGSGSDLSWFYLGRAAGELGYLPAAKTYFERSIVAARRKGVSVCISCSGFKFPDDSVRHLSIIETHMNEAAP